MCAQQQSIKENIVRGTSLWRLIVLSVWWLLAVSIAGAASEFEQTHPQLLPGDRVLPVSRVQVTHQHQIGRADRRGHRVDAAPTDPYQLCLTADRPCVGGIHHRVALSPPTLVSAPAQQSCSSVSGPILACTAFRSIGGSAGEAPPPKRSAARSLSGRFHSVI